MSKTVQLGTLIEKAHLKYGDFESSEPLEAFGVSNTDGITQTAHRKSDDLGSYLVIEPGAFAYNPYRINVGSIGLTPDGLTGVVSPAYIVFRAKPRKLVPEVLLEFLKSKEGLRQINKLARGTVRKALRYDDLCEIEFPSIGYDQQLAILKSKIEFNKIHERLLSEITHQKSLLGKLKQAILQEAIQGKLTEAWRAANPDVEPASELLQRIQAEKARLIAEKKIRKEKPLPEITPEEIPFEIPDGWDVTRLRDVSWIRGGITKNSAKRDGHKLSLPYLRVANVYANRLELAEIKEIGLAESEVDKYLLETHDLLVVEGNGSKDQVGRIAIWNGSITPCLHQNHLINVRLLDKSLVNWALLFYLSPFGREVLEEQARTSTGLYNLSTGKIAGLPILIPPLAEQAAIVERVEALMATCRELEAEIERARTHAADLLQAVLKEAFAPTS